jgi:hypothetical protein
MKRRRGIKIGGVGQNIDQYKHREVKESQNIA